MLARERLAAPADEKDARRAQLEVEYLRRLMLRDAKIWQARTAYATGGINPDELDAEKQDGVHTANGQQPNGHRIKPTREDLEVEFLRKLKLIPSL